MIGREEAHPESERRKHGNQNRRLFFVGSDACGDADIGISGCCRPNKRSETATPPACSGNCVGTLGPVFFVDHI